MAGSGLSSRLRTDTGASDLVVLALGDWDVAIVHAEDLRLLFADVPRGERALRPITSTRGTSARRRSAAGEHPAMAMCVEACALLTCQ